MLETHLLRVQLALPLLWQVVRVVDDALEEHLGVKHLVVLRHHPSRDRENRPKEGDVEEDRPMLGDLKVEDQIRVEYRAEDQNGGERAGDERHESAE